MRADELRERNAAGGRRSGAVRRANVAERNARIEALLAHTAMSFGEVARAVGTSKSTVARVAREAAGVRRGAARTEAPQ